MASHDDIAHGVAKQLKAPAAVVQHEVRRLGVDYSLNVDKKRKLTVAKGRATRHKARWTLLRSFRKVARGPFIFQAGLLPGTLYGTNCYRPENNFLRKLQAQWADCQAARPLGVPKKMWIIGQEPHLDPLFKGSTAGMPGKYGRPPPSLDNKRM